MRAILLASATAANFGGLRLRSSVNQDDDRPPRRTCWISPSSRPEDPTDPTAGFVRARRSVLNGESVFHAGAPMCTATGDRRSHMTAATFHFHALTGFELDGRRRIKEASATRGSHALSLSRSALASFGSGLSMPSVNWSQHSDKARPALSNSLPVAGADGSCSCPLATPATTDASRQPTVTPPLTKFNLDPSFAVVQ